MQQGSQTSGFFNGIIDSTNQGPLKGNAAVDVIGHSLGKASGGYISGGLLILTAASDLMFVAPYMMTIVVFVIAIWILAVVKLNKMYSKLVAEEEIKDRIALDQAIKLH